MKRSELLSMPTNIFIAFANEDRDVRDKLLRQMNLVKDRERWNIWSSHELKAGADWSAEIQERLDNSEVVVLLLSTNFFNSKYIRDHELPAMVAKHRAGNCHIIPVIARECLWKDTDFGDYASMGALQALPVGEKPIVSKVHWDSDDAPYVQTVKGIKDSIRSFQQKKKSPKVVPPKYPHRPMAWGRWVGVGAVVLMLGLVGWMLNRYEPGVGATSNHLVTTKNHIPVEKPPAPNVTIEKIGDIDYTMVFVEGGSFVMGQPNPNLTCIGCSSDECSHSLSVQPFSIGQTEVTQSQWKAVMGETPAFNKGDNLPVENVNWNDVQAFIKKLNIMSGKSYRLPMEKEWEYAARGGNYSRKTKYSGSDNLEEVAWYQANSGNKVHPVGTKKANELDLYDMSGNVWEFCSDQYGPYPGCLMPKKTENSRVIRGGCSANHFYDCYSTNRYDADPGYRGVGTIGFRLAHD